MRLSKPSPAMVVATAALFVALGGGAYAGVTLANDSVRSNHIVNGQVKARDLANEAVGVAKLRNNAVNSTKVKDGSLEVADLSAGAQTSLRTPSSSAGGDLSGTYPNPQIAADAVGSAEIAADAVGSAEIAPGAVGSTDLAANEPWHVVGTAGEPAFQSGWSNSPLGVIPTSARFRRDVAGTIHVVGQIQGGTVSCATGIVFTLPAGYRPLSDRFLGITSTDGNNVVTPATAFIDSAGNVKVCAGNNAYVSLDNISFIP